MYWAARNGATDGLTVHTATVIFKIVAATVRGRVSNAINLLLTLLYGQAK